MTWRFLFLVNLWISDRSFYTLLKNFNQHYLDSYILLRHLKGSTPAMHDMHPCSNSQNIILAPTYPANLSVPQTIEVCTNYVQRSRPSSEVIEKSQDVSACRKVLVKLSWFTVQWLLYKSLGIMKAELVGFELHSAPTISNCDDAWFLELIMTL